MLSDKAPNLEGNSDKVCDKCHGAHKTSEHDFLIIDPHKQSHPGDYDYEFELNKPSIHDQKHRNK